MTMTRAQLDLIPDRLLRRDGHATAALIDWLYARGWQLSLAELEDERTHRGIASRRQRVPPPRQERAA